MDLENSPRTFSRAEWLILIVTACILAVLPFAPYLPWLLLAGWCAHLTSGWYKSLLKVFRNEHLAALAIVAIILLFAVVPTVVLIDSTTDDIRPVISEVINPNGAVAQFLKFALPARLRWRLSHLHWDAMIQSRGGDVLAWSQSIGIAIFSFLGSILVFFLALYVFLRKGTLILEWSYQRIPGHLVRKHFFRIVTVVKQSGEGLIIGVGLTGFAQAAVATLTYWFLGVPSPFFFGALTFVASLLPSVGTALVWAPITAGLFITQNYIASGIMLCVGLFAISLIDNLLRPLVSRRGDFELHWFVFILSIFGGVVTLGGWGFVLGPFFVRLAIELFDIIREEGASESAESGSTF